MILSLTRICVATDTIYLRALCSLCAVQTLYCTTIWCTVVRFVDLLFSFSTFGALSYGSQNKKKRLHRYRYMYTNSNILYKCSSPFYTLAAIALTALPKSIRP